MKLSFDEALQAMNYGQHVSYDDVKASALERYIWISEWHLPGCLSESFSIVTTKRDAIDCALSMAEGAEGPPRGMRADLVRYGHSNRTAPDAWAHGAITTIRRVKLSSYI